MTEFKTATDCGVGIRGVAMAIDSVVWGGLFMIAVTVIGAVTGEMQTTAQGIESNLEGTPAQMGLGLWLVLALGYHSVFEWRFGKTVGKYLVGIEVVNTGGSRVSLWRSIIRNLLRPVDWLPLFYLVGILSMVPSARKRRLGDRFGRTRVVRK
jgi:uncharacterized RDD family membrane protein YckC